MVSALATATEQVASLERDVELAARLTAEREAAGEERVVAAELGRLLSARGFERWLVAEALHRLAEGASATLHVLSGGQFSLVIDADGEFAVVDHGNGDELRPVRTLSGGETFQASLALALALADELSGMASGGATKLDAIFLDEGFGTLDPESLDTVAATIESLGTGGRMVGIVTHVRELADTGTGPLRGPQGPHDLHGRAGGRLIRVTIDPWDPSYGTSADEAGAESEAAIDLAVERPLAAWSALGPPPDVVMPEVIQFVDGVRASTHGCGSRPTRAPRRGPGARSRGSDDRRGAGPSRRWRRRGPRAWWCAPRTDGCRRHSVPSRSAGVCSRRAPRPPTSSPATAPTSAVRPPPARPTTSRWRCSRP